MNKFSIITNFVIIAMAFAACNRTQQQTASAEQTQTDTETKDLFVYSEENPIKIVSDNNETPTEAVLELYKQVLLKETGNSHDFNFSLFTVLDMDIDGTPEIVLHNSSNGNSLVLHYYNGPEHGKENSNRVLPVYRKEYSYRAMRNLKTDGSFSWSNSASNSGTGKLRFSGAEQETEYLAEYSTEDIEMYRINGSPVSQNDFDAYTALQDAKKDVVWRLVTIGNINNLGF